MQARIFQSNAARRVLNAPKESLKTAKQTLENCQENLQTLGNLLHKTVAQAQSVHIQTRITAPEAEPVRRSLSAQSVAELALVWLASFQR